MSNNETALKTYLISKIEELEHKIQEKSQNVKRLQAQRNELNNNGLI
jgi:26S proteasome regulatory subunit T6